MNTKKYWISTNGSISDQVRGVFNECLLSLKLENKAEATITKYKWILEIFLTDCQTPLDELTSKDVLTWLNNYTDGKKPKTIDLVLATLSSFFQFCLEEEYMETMVIKKRWKPKIPSSLPKYFDEYEYARVKRAAEELPIRDRALILFLSSSECRVSEVSNLNIHDVHLQKRTAEVKGKGGKVRHVHFSEECAMVLQNYLTTRTNEPTAPLFKNKFGNRLLVGGIQQVTKKLSKRTETIITSS